MENNTDLHIKTALSMAPLYVNSIRLGRRTVGDVPNNAFVDKKGTTLRKYVLELLDKQN